MPQTLGQALVKRNVSAVRIVVKIASRRYAPGTAIDFLEPVACIAVGNR
jgi:hypothetical protein